MKNTQRYVRCPCSTCTRTKPQQFYRVQRQGWLQVPLIIQTYSAAKAEELARNILRHKASILTRSVQHYTSIDVCEARPIKDGNRIVRFQPIFDVADLQEEWGLECEYNYPWQ